MKILVIGVNGFIGCNLAKHILAHTDWQIVGIDLGDNCIQSLQDHHSFSFIKGDIFKNTDWLKNQIKRCDVVLPLAAIANPFNYVENPLEVFELDFMANLFIIRKCFAYKTRVVFPSTSEVYGMCPDQEFNEETSSLVRGPISKQRWIYACSKELLDRVIWAYGNLGLLFTIFRPFNWFGPNLDDINKTGKGSARVITQFLGNLLRNEPILLVDGGDQYRSFTYIEDGIDALIHIIRNHNGAADGEIFNIGNPANEISIRSLASLMVEILGEFPGFDSVADQARIRTVNAEEYFNKGYQDIQKRVPDIHKIRDAFGWEPQVPVKEGLKRMFSYYISQHSQELLSGINEKNAVFVS